MMQPVRIYPHSPLERLAREAGLVGPGEDLLEPRFWNPAPLSLAVEGVQRGARLAFRLRRASKGLR
jgi:hypothetical protein